MPPSAARSRIATDVGSSHWSPNVIVPRQMRETWRPVRPRRTCCIAPSCRRRLPRAWLVRWMRCSPGSVRASSSRRSSSPDLDAAMAAFTEHAGCEHWTTFPAIGTPYRYRGRDIESSVALAFSRSGRVQIELLQPIDGEGLTHDFLAEYGPGAHHLGFLVEDAAAAVAAAEARRHRSRHVRTHRHTALRVPRHVRRARCLPRGDRRSRRTHRPAHSVSTGG